ncbi:hypothetical protein Nmel_001310 [Mimus melanotis]
MPDCQIAGTSEDAGSNDSEVHHTTCVGHSQVDEQAEEIHTQEVSVDYSELRQVLDSVIVTTENFSMSCMERLYALLSQCIYRHREDDDKTELVKVNSISWKSHLQTLSFWPISTGLGTEWDLGISYQEQGTERNGTTDIDRDDLRSTCPMPS